VQSRKQNDYFTDWKHKKLIDKTEALQFFEGELYKFEHLYKVNKDVFCVVLADYSGLRPEQDFIIDIYKKRIETLKRYLEEIEAAEAETGGPRDGREKEGLNPDLNELTKDLYESHTEIFMAISQDIRSKIFETIIREQGENKKYLNFKMEQREMVRYFLNYTNIIRITKCCLLNGNPIINKSFSTEKGSQRKPRQTN
jgi:hypothetical protein